MLQILTKATVVVLAVFVLMLGSSPVALAACPSNNSSKGQVLRGVGQTGSNCSDSGVSRLLKTIVNILSYLAGAIAVIMIILAGLKYITSNGSSEGISSAKNTLIYAMIGLVVAVLAQFLVQFVLSQSTSAT